MFGDFQKDRRLQIAKEKGEKALYEGYWAIRDATKEPTNAESIEYLKLFVQHDYRECIRIVREKDNKHLTLRAYDDDYVHFIALIAAYYLDRGYFIRGMVWTVKALNFYNLLYRSFDREKRHEMLSDRIVVEIFNEYYHFFPLDDFYDSFYLNWELKKGLHLDYQLHHNDDTKTES